MKTYHTLSKNLDAMLTTLNTIKTSPEWLALMQEPSAHPDLLTDFATCLAAGKDLHHHVETSLCAIKQAADRRQDLLQETQEEAA